MDPGTSAFAHNGALDTIEMASATGIIPDNPSAAATASVDGDLGSSAL